MKICKVTGCNSPVFSSMLCAYHSKIEKAKLAKSKPRKPIKVSSTPKTNKSVSKPLKKAPINKISDKQKLRLAEYKKLRDEFIDGVKLCEVCGIRVADQVHHKKGKVGDDLFKFFLAVCAEDHRKIEDNPEWAKENGYSLDRLSK